MRTLRQQIEQRCVNHRPHPHATCTAGVAYSTLRVLDNCVSGPGPKVTCSRHCAPTPEQVDAELAEVNARLAEMDELIAGHRCLQCREKIERAKQAGSCMYAEPCGHRIGQGDAATFNRELKLAKVA